MTYAFRFAVPGNPRPWQRAGYNRKTGQFFKRPVSRNYGRLVQAYARRAKVKVLAGPVTLAVHFWRETAHQCDLDNLVKAIKDALIGVAYGDDSQIVSVTAEKSVDRDNPRAEVQIRSAA